MRTLKPVFFPKIWNRMDRYLFSEVHPPFLMAMMIYNGIFFIDTFTKITGLAGEVELPFSLFLFLFLSYVPQILFMTIPISFLFASQAAFARMSSDSEIIAPLSTGVSFWRMNRPIVAYGLFLSAFTFILANWLAPNMAQLADQKYRAFLGSTAIPTLTPGVITNLGKKDVLYVDRIAGQTYLDLIHISHDTGMETVTFAREAEFLNDGQGGWSLELKKASIKSFSTKEERSVETAYYNRLKRDFPRQGVNKQSLFENPESRQDSLQLLSKSLQTGDIWSHESIEIIRRIWLSVTCLIFSFFAAPLSAKHSRLGGGSSFGISLLFIAVFMFMFKNGEDQALAKSLYPLIAISAAPVSFLILGLFLQIGKHRGWGHWSHKLKDRWLFFSDTVKSRILNLPARLGRRQSDIKKSKRAAYTSRFPTKIDLYVIRFFLRTWILVQLSVLVLILLIEYSQISSFVKRNQIDNSTLLEYLAFRTPELVDTTIFFCLLISVLIVFALMSKHQEVTAIRAGGGSLQRLCMPLIIFGFLASINSFYIENLVLPWSNRNAYRLRNVIKNKEPALFTSDVWIKSGKNQLLNFKFFDRGTRTLHDSVFYALDPEDHGLNSRSTFEAIQFSYKDGWVNQQDTPLWQFKSVADGEELEQSVISKGAIINVGLDLSDLEQKKRNPSEFSISQLREYYQYLHDLGYNANLFYTEMLAKMAQPLLPLIMMLLAMPMGFQYGRRGSFYGMGLGILTGLCFWVFFELFKELGASGALPAPLAAWGIICIFSLASIWRFVRMGQ